MIHAKNEKAWFAKSRAPHLGGRVIIVRGPVTCLRVRVVLAVPIGHSAVPVSRENGDPLKWAPRIPIFLVKWAPGSLFYQENGDPGSPFSL